MPNESGDKAAPKSEDRALYFVRGSTLNQWKASIRMDRPCGVTNGGVLVGQLTAQGAYLSASNKGGGQSTAGDDLPDADPSLVYFLTESYWEKLLAAARANHTRVVTNGGLVIESETTNGVTVGLVPSR